MATRFSIFLIFVFTAQVTLAQSGAEIPPPGFEAASPTNGLWKGWAVGTTVTFRTTFADRVAHTESVQFHRLLLVGRSADGGGLVASYQAKLEDGPWRFGQTASAGLRGFLHDPGIQQISQRADKLSVDNKPIECVVRGYTGTRQTRWGEHVEGEEWTVGSDGPVIKSSVEMSYQIAGQKYAGSEQISCSGQESLKFGTRELTAFRTVEEKRMDSKLIGGNSERWYSADVPGWLVVRSTWNQPDKQQSPTSKDELIAFGSDAELLARYAKTDRPLEITRNQAYFLHHPATQPTSKSSQ